MARGELAQLKGLRMRCCQHGAGGPSQRDGGSREVTHSAFFFFLPNSGG